MRTSQFETMYLKTKTQTDLKLYKKHKGKRKILWRKERKEERSKYYESVDMKNVLDSKKFWKTTGPFLSDENTVFSQINIEKNNRIISDDFVLSEEFSTFFEGAVRSLSVEPDEYFLSDTENLSSPVEIAIRKSENHPSIQTIKQNISVKKDFYFSNTEIKDILKETTDLNNKKNGTFGNIPTKLLKEVSDICAPALMTFGIMK